MRSGLLEARIGWSNERPEFDENIANYIRFAREHSIVAAEVLADPQTDRSMGSANHPGLLRVVETTSPTGSTSAGSKSVGSLAAQADEIIFTNVRRPDYPPEALIQAAIPVGTEGLTLDLPRRASPRPAPTRSITRSACSARKPTSC